jgi:ABC-type tungstate transport system substrate-binding protein
VISPDDAALSSNYHPDLQRWLIPETATDSGDAIDVEELVNVVFAYVLGIAQHHRTRVIVTVVRKHGGAFLIRVAENTVAGLLVYWLLSR